MVLSKKELYRNKSDKSLVYIVCTFYDVENTTHNVVYRPIGDDQLYGMTSVRFKEVFELLPTEAYVK